MGRGGERTLTLVLAGDDKGLRTTLDQTERKVDGFGSKVQGMGTKAKAAMVGLAAGAVAFGASSVSAFMESEEAQSKLTEAYEKFPQLAGANIKKLQELNSERAKTTKFDDDATASGQAVLAQFGLTQDQLLKLTPLLQDYAQRTGKDLPTAAQDLGKAVNGQGRALKALGIEFKDTGSKAGNFDQLVGSLDKSVGGFAETAGKTTSGKVAILKNQFGELQEKVGGFLVPALLKLSDVGLKVVDFVSNLNPGVLVAIGAVAGLATAVYLIVQAQKAWAAAQLALNIVMSANPIVLVVAAVAAFVAGLVIAYQKVDWFRNIVDTAFGAVKAVVSGTFGWISENWPLLLAVLTGPIGLAVLTITRHWDDIKSGVSGVRDWIVGRFEDVVGFVSGIPDRLAGVGAGLWNWVGDGLEAAVDWVIDRFQGMLGAVVGAINGIIDAADKIAGPVINFGEVAVPNLPGGTDENKRSSTAKNTRGLSRRRMAEGSVVRARPGGVDATVGEGGYDEAVLPLSERSLAPFAAALNAARGGGVTELHITVMLDDEKVGHSVTRYQERQGIRNGPR